VPKRGSVGKIRGGGIGGGKNLGTGDVCFVRIGDKTQLDDNMGAPEVERGGETEG